MKSSGAVYHSMFHLLICDTSQLITLAIFGVLAAMGTSDLTDVHDIHGFLVCVFFHVNCSLLILTAFNRNMIFACWASWIFSISVHGIIFYMTPCCHFMTSYRHFTIKWRNPNGEFIYSDYFMHLPYDIFTISAVVICYGLVIAKIKKTNKASIVKSRTHKEKRQAQEMRITIQFLVISMLLLPVPIGIRLFPFILPSPFLREINIVLVAGAMMNSSINAIIYLIYNEDIKTRAKQLFGMRVTRRHSNTSQFVWCPTSTDAREQDLTERTPMTLLDPKPRVTKSYNQIALPLLQNGTQSQLLEIPSRISSSVGSVNFSSSL